MTAVLLASANFGESYILEIVGLVLVAVFVVRKVAPPLRRAMDKQAETIRGQLAAGDEAQAGAERLVVARRAELEHARVEAAHIVEQASTSAEQLVAEGRRRAEDERKRLVARAEVEIGLARARAREEVTRHVAQLVVDAAEAVVAAELDATTHHHLIGEAIAAAETEGR